MWIIDAYNVLGARPDGWWHDRAAALARLCDAIAAWRPAGDEVLVVVDGRPGDVVPEGIWHGIEIRYAHTSAPDAADHVIVDVVRAAEDPTALTVVSSDAEVRADVTDLGAGVEGAGAFRARLDARP